MKIFVFEEVLCDYTCGMVLVAAESHEEALEYARKEFEYDFEMNEDGWKKATSEYECVGVKAGVLNYVYGGG